MEFLERVRWTNETPDIRVNYYYEYQRSGADMKYRVKVVVEPVTGQRYFGYPIYVKAASEGADRVSTTMKASSPSQWSNNIEWTSDWFTIANKTSGTSSLAFTMWSGNGSSRNQTNSYSMYVAPAYASCTQSLKNRYETSITMNWSSDNTCDYLWYSTNNGSSWTAVGSINASSGSYTINGLTAGQTYSIKTRIRRKDSQLTTDSSKTDVTTYNYPSCSSAPNFTIGNNVTLQLNNPLNRPVELQMYSHIGSCFINTTRISTTANGNYTFNASDYTSQLYASIPNAKTSQYNIDVWYGNNKAVKAGGYYSVNENTNKPTFSDFTYADTNATTVALTGNNQTVVQGYSNVTATVLVANKASAQNSATMKRYNLVIGSGNNSVDYSSSSDVSVTVNNAQSGTITLYAEDSRGLSTSITKTATLKTYTAIQKSGISATRQSNVGEAVTLKYNGTFWNDSFGDQTNDITSATYRFKKTTDSSWTNGTTTITPTKDGNTYSFEGGIIGDILGTGFDAAYSYNIEVTVSDKLSSTTFTITLGSGSPNMAFVNGGVSLLGKYDESNTTQKIQLNAPTKINGNTQVIGNIKVGGNVDLRNISDANIEWKEPNYGDKFRIIPNFSGADDSNKLKIQGTVGEQGTDPTNWADLMTISGKSGNVGVGKSIQIPKNGGAGYGLTNSDGASIIRDHNNKNVTVDATGATLYLGYQNTTGINILNSKATINSSGLLNAVGGLQANGINALLTNAFRFRLYQKSMTIPANGMAALDMGAVNTPSGYSLLGVIPYNNGYSDQWVVTYSAYSNDHIIAMGHSKYGASLTTNVICYAVYINNNLKSTMIL